MHQRVAPYLQLSTSMVLDPIISERLVKEARDLMGGLFWGVNIDSDQLSSQRAILLLLCVIRMFAETTFEPTTRIVSIICSNKLRIFPSIESILIFVTNTIIRPEDHS